LAGATRSRVDRAEQEEPALEEGLERMAERSRTEKKRRDALVEQVDRYGFAAAQDGVRESGEQRGLAASRRSHDERARASRDATADEGIERFDVGADGALRRGPFVLRRDEAREHADPALRDAVVMEPAAE